MSQPTIAPPMDILDRLVRWHDYIQHKHVVVSFSADTGYGTSELEKLLHEAAIEIQRLRKAVELTRQSEYGRGFQDGYNHESHKKEIESLENQIEDLIRSPRD